MTDNGHKLGTAVRALHRRRMPTPLAGSPTQCDSQRDGGFDTPATDNALRARCDAIGLEDVWPIQREAFTRWVIENDFSGEGPALDRVGATFTLSVAGYEEVKLRLLNGAHSSLAYVGLELGYQAVTEAMRDDALAAFVEQLMLEDITPSLRPPHGLDPDAYIAAILARLRKPAAAHRYRKSRGTGRKKLPYRILDTVRSASATDRAAAVPVAA